MVLELYYYIIHYPVQFIKYYRTYKVSNVFKSVIVSHVLNAILRMDENLSNLFNVIFVYFILDYYFLNIGIITSGNCEFD